MSKFKIQNFNSKLRTFTFLVVFFTFAFWVLNLDTVRAVTPRMESPRFRIDWGNLNMGGKDSSSSGYELSTTLGQTAAGKFQSDGYIVKAGFQYLHSIIPFTFTVSNTSLNLGEIIPDNPAIASTTLTVSFGSAGQYQVTTSEQGPLQTLSANFIPDTQCNGGAETCNESTAKLWNQPSAYGFGYTLTGDDIPSDFVSTEYYRPFPDSTINEAPVVIMSNSNVGKSRQATMNFKVNISSVQPAGSYQTIINYVALPSY